MASILVLDDESAVVSVLKSMLEAKQHTVRGMTDPVEALEVLSEEDCPIELIITDQVMPGLNGLSLLRDLRSRKVETPAILVTGLLSEEVAGQAKSIRLCEPMTKPVDTDHLYRLVDRLLDLPEEINGVCDAHAALARRQHQQGLDNLRIEHKLDALLKRPGVIRRMFSGLAQAGASGIAALLALLGTLAANPKTVETILRIGKGD